MPFNTPPLAAASTAAGEQIFYLSVFADAFCKSSEFLPIKNNSTVEEEYIKISQEPGGIEGFFKKQESDKNFLPHMFCARGKNAFITHQSWTDDSAMAFCLAEALQQAIIEQRNDFTQQQNIRKFSLQLMQLFHDWWHSRRNSGFDATGHSIGLGGGISLAIRWFNSCLKNHYSEQSTKTNYGLEAQLPDDGKFDIIAEVANQWADKTRAEGNGGIMRIAPVLLAAKNIDEAMAIADIQSRVTAPGDQAAACARFLAYILFQAAHNTDIPLEEKKEALFSQKNLSSFLEKLGQNHPAYEVMNGLLLNQTHPDPKEKHPEYQWKVAFKDYTKNPTTLAIPNQIGYYGSYVMDGLALALNIIFSSNTAKEAISKVRLLGGDADSIGSFVAAMAAVILDTKDLPAEWLALLNNSPINIPSEQEQEKLNGVDDVFNFIKPSTLTVPEFIKNYAAICRKRPITLSSADYYPTETNPKQGNLKLTFRTSEQRDFFLEKIGGQAPFSKEHPSLPTTPHPITDGENSLIFYAYIAQYDEVAVTFSNNQQRTHFQELINSNECSACPDDLSSLLKNNYEPLNPKKSDILYFSPLLTLNKTWKDKYRNLLEKLKNRHHNYFVIMSHNLCEATFKPGLSQEEKLNEFLTTQLAERSTTHTSALKAAVMRFFKQKEPRTEESSFLNEARELVKEATIELAKKSPAAEQASSASSPKGSH